MEKTNDLESNIHGLLFGVCVGDALGVPVEFKSRDELKVFPVEDMMGFGSHNQPIGTWSDDSSLTFCLAESLLSGFDLNDISRKFQDWYYNAHWTPHGEVFDIGNATLNAIEKLKIGIVPEFAGGMEENDNGNGALMRILPIIFYSKDKTIKERYQIVKSVSSITHAHFRSIFSCFIYTEFALHLFSGKSLKNAYKTTQKRVLEFISNRDFKRNEIDLFSRVLKKDISKENEYNISGSGYVLHSLEASIWCLVTTGNYQDAVLKAVNLGEDTDTIGAITGGLAGIYYEISGIPKKWIEVLAKKKEIWNLADKLNRKFNPKLL
ncbi:MAG: ADP-ribosylglycohydrolase family protein [Flammeovirgaceae bacterium]|nr:ADP-ribosylglycohydrolase family protein [Flammeovirgaceae bacterium]